jgi:hypothetical protein
MQVERGAFVAIREYPSGERVSNALVTYPKVWDNSPKAGLIPDVVIGIRIRCLKEQFALGGACVPSASW